MVDLFLGLFLIWLLFKVLQLSVRGICWCVKKFWIWLSKGEKSETEGKNGSELTGAYSDEESRELLDELDKAKKKSVFKKTREDREREAHLRKLYEIKRAQFLDEVKVGWYQMVVIFLGGSVLGLILEQIWMLITAGLTESRVGLVWGPFSPLYGFGAALVTAACLIMRKKHAKAWQIFLVSAVVGGLLEQVTGWGMEVLFHAQSWSYAHLPDAITKWVAWRFLFFWGILGLLWSYAIAPELIYRIGRPTTRRQIIFVALVALYLGADIWMTLQCFSRKTARDAGIEPENAFEEWIDEHYNDEFIAGRFQNLVISEVTDGVKSN